MMRYVAFLRGINVGGHHKVPMAELRKEMERLNFQKVTTILNSGNILFESEKECTETFLANHLEATFGFPVPTLLRQFQELAELYERDPFQNIEVTKSIRRYVSFLKKEEKVGLVLPWESDDGSYKILEQHGKNIFSVLDVAVSNTPKAMDALEQYYGKEITTRNWNTVERIMKKAAEQHWV